MKYILTLGIGLGLWFGVNIGKGNALYDNPFAEKSLMDDILDSADDEGLLDKGERILEESANKVKEKAKETLDDI